MTASPSTIQIGDRFVLSQAIHLVVVGFLSSEVAITEDWGPAGDGRRGTMAARHLLAMHLVG